ncbi:3-oxoacyl-[acyl-carrier-protein] synthase-3 [Gracilibacillus alcaliphilus]|nr:beta-ketoacyl-ACP synthase III [Gracilibacillus alcaliphilus]MBM7677409.1 3-oxoacyl-[acyl-carrier-protein] synthase-3 [Gracilibacillus alcaliphilus]
MSQYVKIIGVGKYMPRRVVTSEELDQKLRVKPGWVERKTDVRSRHYAETETASEMGAYAIQEALEAAQLSFEDIDCIVAVSGTAEQEIPCTASLIQKALGQEHSGVPAFDINSTCLSFLVGLDMMSYVIEAGRYQRVVFVSSEIASIGLNWEHKESAALFGDGAAAVIVERGDQQAVSRILSSKMETYSAGAEFSQIRGGGTKLHPRITQELEPFLFEMNGKAIYKMAAKLLPDFVDTLLKEANCTMADIDVVIPHQGSAMAMRLITKKLGISEQQLMYITPTHGNTIAASLPMGLYEALHQGRLKRGDRILLLGTSAGLSLGGMVLVY